MLFSAAIAVIAACAIPLAPVETKADGIVSSPTTFQVATAGTESKNCASYKYQIAKSDNDGVSTDGLASKATTAPANDLNTARPASTSPGSNQIASTIGAAAIAGSQTSAQQQL